MGENVAKVLNGPAVGPDGDRFKAGQAVPAHWPGWFVADLERAEHLQAPPAAAMKTSKPRARKATR